MLYLNIKQILLEILIINAVISAILTIIAKNPVISVIFLISLILNAALYLILKGISFVGISYILIYLGAIIVLFLFVIMMINVRLTDILETGYQYTRNIPLALTVAGIFLYIFLNLLPSYLNSPVISLNHSIFYNIIKDIIQSVNNIIISFPILFKNIEMNNAITVSSNIYDISLTGLLNNEYSVSILKSALLSSNIFPLMTTNN